MLCFIDGWSSRSCALVRALRQRRPWLVGSVVFFSVWLAACSLSSAPDLAGSPAAAPTLQTTQVTTGAPVDKSPEPSPASVATPSRAVEVQAPRITGRAGRTVLGYYVPYDASSWESLVAHHGDLDYVAVQMASVDACGNLSSTDDQTLLRAAHGWGVRVLLSLFAGSGSPTHSLLASEGAIENLVSQVTEHVRTQGYDGLDLDLEGVPAADRAAQTRLVTKLGESLRRENKTFSMAVPAKTEDTTSGWSGAYDYAALGRQVDLMVVMAYAYTTASSPPGSTAPLPWVEKVARFVASQVSRDKALLGVPFYGYDWNTTTASAARALRYPEAAVVAQSKGKSIVLDNASQSATFGYSTAPGDVLPTVAPSPRLNHEITQRQAPVCQTATSTPSTSPAPSRPTPKPTITPSAVQQHVVWLEDARTLLPRLDLAVRYGLTGVAAWRLGQEDPGVWPVLEQWRRLSP